MKMRFSILIDHDLYTVKSYRPGDRSPVTVEYFPQKDEDQRFLEMVGYVGGVIFPEVPEASPVTEVAPEVEALNEQIQAEVSAVVGPPPPEPVGEGQDPPREDITAAEHATLMDRLRAGAERLKR